MKNDNLKFHNEASEDPDCFMKKVFLFLIVARKKLKKVLINFWKMAQEKEEHLEST